MGRLACPARVRAMVTDRAAYGALVLPPGGAGILLVANGGGHAVATILVQLGQQVARTGRTTLRTVDVAPTTPNNPNGTAEFYCVAFLMLGSAIGGDGAGPGRASGLMWLAGVPGRLAVLGLPSWRLAGRRPGRCRRDAGPAICRPRGSSPGRGARSEAGRRPPGRT